MGTLSGKTTEITTTARLTRAAHPHRVVTRPLGKLTTKYINSTSKNSYISTVATLHCPASIAASVTAVWQARLKNAAALTSAIRLRGRRNTSTSAASAKATLPKNRMGTRSLRYHSRAVSPAVISDEREPPRVTLAVTVSPSAVTTPSLKTSPAATIRRPASSRVASWGTSTPSMATSRPSGSPAESATPPGYGATLRLWLMSASRSWSRGSISVQTSAATGTARTLRPTIQRASAASAAHASHSRQPESVTPGSGGLGDAGGRSGPVGCGTETRAEEASAMVQPIQGTAFRQAPSASRSGPDGGRPPSAGRTGRAFSL